MSITLIVVMVSWELTYVQTHRIMHIKYVQSFVYQLSPIKLFTKRQLMSANTKMTNVFELSEKIFQSSPIKVFQLRIIYMVKTNDK